MNNYRLSKRILENWKVCGSFLKKRNWIIFIRVFLKSGKILFFYGKLLAPVSSRQVEMIAGKYLV